jgi:hypothetical protein
MRAGHKAAVLGGVVWSVLFALSLGNVVALDPIIRLFLLALWVVAPLGLQVIYGRMDIARSFIYLQPIAAGLATISFFISAGSGGAVLYVFPWLLWTASAGLIGVMRAWKRGWVLSEELVMDAGLLYLAAGGGWLFVSRMAATPMGFKEPIILLTAVHFHFAGFAVAVITGALGRYLRERPELGRKWFPLVAAGAVAGMPMVATGFVFSPAFKVFAIGAFVLSLAGLSVISLFTLPTIQSRLGKGLLAVSAVSLLFAMALAMAYGIEEFRQRLFRDHLWSQLLRMVHTHGILNALGFTLCGLLGWTLIEGGSPWKSRN